MSSPLEGSTSLISLIVTIITGVVVAVLYVTTRFGKGEIKGAVVGAQTTQIANTIGAIQEEFKENYKDLRKELKDLSKEVQQLNSTLSLEKYTSNEIKQTANDLTKRVNDLERKMYVLDRRINGTRGRRPDDNGDSSIDSNIMFKKCMMRIKLLCYILKHCDYSFLVMPHFFNSFICKLYLVYMCS